MSARLPGDGVPKWATFYDIRRYGGLQIFLRALIGGTDLVLSSEGEPIGEHLRRLAAAGVTAISGTPSHWRRVLMSQERTAIAPRYVRLSGEIADQFVLDGLRAAYPDAVIGHAYASTEAGVGFAVDDGLEGFPAALVETPPAGLEVKVVDGSLRIRSRRAASRYLAEDAPQLADDDGFIDTGDLVERRGDRFYFVGRRGGIINVGGLKVNPEEVEAALNSHAAVRMSLVRARKNPLTRRNRRRRCRAPRPRGRQRCPEAKHPRPVSRPARPPQSAGHPPLRAEPRADARRKTQSCQWLKPCDAT